MESNRITSRPIILAIATVALLAFGQKAAQGADRYVNLATGTDGPTCGSLASPCKTIQPGIDNASANDTVNVAAGTYVVTQVSINKALVLKGAGSATTIIDGADNRVLTDGAGTVVVGGPFITSFPGLVTIDGFTIQHFHARSPDDQPMAISSEYNEATLTIQNCHLVGNANPNDFAIGVWVIQQIESQPSPGRTTVQDNEIEKVWQGMLFERPSGGASVLRNIIHDLTPSGDPVIEGQGVAAMTYTVNVPGNVSALMDVSSNKFSGYSGASVRFTGGYPGSGVGKFSNVQITGNTINAIGSGPERFHVGISLSNPPEGAPAAGGVPNAVISGNTISGTDNTNDSKGIWLRGPSDHVRVTGNEISGVNMGIASTDYCYDPSSCSGFSADLGAHANNITGNGIGVSNGTSAPADIIDATCDWWGSASGPGPVGPGTGDRVSANVVFAPWLIAPAPGDGICAATQKECKKAVEDQKKAFDQGQQTDKKNFDQGQQTDKKNFDQGQQTDKKNFDATHPSPQDRKAFDDQQHAAKKTFDDNQKDAKKTFDDNQKAAKKAFEDQNKADEKACDQLPK